MFRFSTGSLFLACSDEQALFQDRKLSYAEEPGYEYWEKHL